MFKTLLFGAMVGLQNAPKSFFLMKNCQIPWSQWCNGWYETLDLCPFMQAQNKKIESRSKHIWIWKDASFELKPSSLAPSALKLWRIIWDVSKWKTCLWKKSIFTIFLLVILSTRWTARRLWKQLLVIAVWPFKIRVFWHKAEVSTSNVLEIMKKTTLIQHWYGEEKLFLILQKCNSRNLIFSILSLITFGWKELVFNFWWSEGDKMHQKASASF